VKRWGVAQMFTAVGVGALLYFGLLRIPLKHLFTVTSWLILLLAAASVGTATQRNCGITRVAKRSIERRNSPWSKPPKSIYTQK